MISDTKIIEIFCKLDDFSKEYNTVIRKNSISDGSTMNHYGLKVP